MNLFQRAWKAAVASRPERARLTAAGALDLAAAELRRARSSRTDAALVLVDGRSGSGKTRFAADLLNRCPEAQVLHLDDLYPDWDGLSDGVDRARGVVEAWSRGEDVTFSPTRWPGTESRPPMRVEAHRSLVVEGVGARHCLPPADRGRLALPLYLDVPTELRRERALARDGDTFAPHWDAWASQEDDDLRRHPVDADHSDIYVCSGPAPTPN